MYYYWLLGFSIWICDAGDYGDSDSRMNSLSRINSLSRMNSLSGVNSLSPTNSLPVV